MKKYIKVIKSIIKSVIDNDFSGMAAEMGFMLIIGIFPFALFLIEIFSRLGRKSFVNPIFIALDKVMPADALNLIRSVINEVSFYDKGGILAVLGFVITIILSTNAMAVVLKGLNRAYKVEETRSFIYTRLLSLTMVFVNTAILFLTVNLIVFGKVIIKFLIGLGLNVDIANTFLVLRSQRSFPLVNCRNSFLSWTCFEIFGCFSTLVHRLSFGMPSLGQNEKYVCIYSR